MVLEDDDEAWAQQRAAQRSSDGIVVRVAGMASELERVVRAAQAANASVVGFSVEHIRLLRSADLVRVTLVPTAFFRQTPGAGAGGSIEGGARWA